METEVLSYIMKGRLHPDYNNQAARALCKLLGLSEQAENWSSRVGETVTPNDLQMFYRDLTRQWFGGPCGWDSGSLVHKILVAHYLELPALEPEFSEIGMILTCNGVVNAVQELVLQGIDFEVACGCVRWVKERIEKWK